MSNKHQNLTPPPAPIAGLSLAVTGHRSANATFAANCDEIEDVLAGLFNDIADKQNQTDQSPKKPWIRLHSMLVDGLDQIAARKALDLGWELVAPLPFGVRLNTAINAQPANEEDARALLYGQGICPPALQQKADDIADLVEKAHLFELADQDAKIEALFIAKLAAPDDLAKAQAYSFAASKRVAIAAKVMAQQCDLMIGVWDGASTDFIGGTGHTIELALTLGVPVLWIDAAKPKRWRIFQTPEALATRHVHLQTPASDLELFDQLITMNSVSVTTSAKGKRAAFRDGETALEAKNWHTKSHVLWHGYRRIEALCGADGSRSGWRNLTQTYETPDQIAQGSAKGQVQANLALPGQSARFVERLKTLALSRFAWADGISSYLSDCYRGGMVMNFVFSAFAIVGGIAYLPFATVHEKWIFAIFELVLLSAILAITFIGQKLRWHGRWFETRRVAEYLRAAPVLLALGIARPTGRWPKGTHTSWPETYVRQSLRQIGLPDVAITASYLKNALDNLLAPYITEQSQYHHSKAARLALAHHRLDHVSDLLFKFAVVSVTCYLALKLGGVTHILDKEVAEHFSKLLTFLGVLLPTFGGAIAGIRYFGDFERFSAISDVTAQKLDALSSRIALLDQAPEDEISYDLVADLGHALDDVVFDEIDSWQSVFSGKQISVPV